MGAEDRDKPGGEVEPEAPASEVDRPTVAPPVDPLEFAKEVLAGAPPSQAPRPINPHTKATPALGVRPPAATLADPEEVEAARKRSIDTATRHATPTGALSLVNARAPSNLPPVPYDEPPSSGASDRPAHAAAPPTTEQEMSDRLSLGDYTGALAIAEKLLAADPEHAAARGCAANCRAVLRQMYTTKIGPLGRVPLVMVPRDQLRWLSIDHRAGFVLSLVDGVSTLEMILDVSGMPELDALRILCDLAQQRIIAFR